jgi:hypothetical protein
MHEIGWKSPEGKILPGCNRVVGDVHALEITRPPNSSSLIDTDPPKASSKSDKKLLSLRPCGHVAKAKHVPSILGSQAGWVPGHGGF